MTVRKFCYVGEEQLMTRGNYGVNVTGAHTREDDPFGIYVFDPDFGDQLLGSVKRAAELGFVEEEDGTSRDDINRDDIMDLLGASSWDEVVENFDFWCFDVVLEKLNDLFPGEDNEDLALAIVRELS